LGIAGIVLNFIGAIVRWIYGTIWRTLFNKPKFVFSEYINGSSDSNDSFDGIAHQFNNKIIGAIFIGIIISMFT